MPSDIRIFNDVLADPVAYRTSALAQPFGDVTAGDVTFHGIAPCQTRELDMWCANQGLTPTLSFFRQSPAGQVEPNDIHTDTEMGAWTALLYLTPDPPEGDGTTFWRHRATGVMDALTSETWRAEGRQRDRWEPWRHVAARFNRLLLFPSAMFHGRSLVQNYGTGQESRLIQVLFGGW